MSGTGRPPLPSAPLRLAPPRPPLRSAPPGRGRPRARGRGGRLAGPAARPLPLPCWGGCFGTFGEGFGNLGRVRAGEVAVGGWVGGWGAASAPRQVLFRGSASGRGVFRASALPGVCGPGGGGGVSLCDPLLLFGRGRVAGCRGHRRQLGGCQGAVAGASAGERTAPAPHGGLGSGELREGVGGSCPVGGRGGGRTGGGGRRGAPLRDRRRPVSAELPGAGGGRRAGTVASRPGCVAGVVRRCVFGGKAACVCVRVRVCIPARELAGYSNAGHRMGGFY